MQFSRYHKFGRSLLTDEWREDVFPTMLHQGGNKNDVPSLISFSQWYITFAWHGFLIKCHFFNAGIVYASHSREFSRVCIFRTHFCVDTKSIKYLENWSKIVRSLIHQRIGWVILWNFLYLYRRWFNKME